MLPLEYLLYGLMILGDQKRSVKINLPTPSVDQALQISETRFYEKINYLPTIVHILDLSTVHAIRYTIYFYTVMGGDA